MINIIYLDIKTWISQRISHRYYGKYNEKNNVYTSKNIISLGFRSPISSIVLLLDGNSEINACVGSNL